MRYLVRALASLALVAFALLSLASAADAALTEAEQAEVRQFMSAAGYIELGMGTECLGSAVRYSTAASLPHVALAWEHKTTALERTVEGFLLLLGVNYHERGSAEYTTLENTARATWVSTAWTKLAAADAALVSAIAKAADADAAQNGPAGYDSGVACLGSNAGSARTELAGVNQGLSYTTPIPTGSWGEFGTGGRNKAFIVGPHGTYDLAGNLLARAMLSLSASFRSMKGMYDTATLGETIWGAGAMEEIYRVLLAGPALHGDYRVVLKNFSLIPSDTRECAMNDFHLVGRMLEKLLLHCSESCSSTSPRVMGPNHGVPYFFQVNLQGHFDAWKTGFPTRPLAFAKFLEWHVNWLKGWLGGDGATWRLLQFPARDNFERQRAQAVSAASTRTSTLCTDVTAPTVTLLYPNAGQALRGKHTLAATCVDNMAHCRRCRFKVDDVDVGSVIWISPFEHPLDTTMLSNGSHTWTVTCEDQNQNPTTPSTRSFTVVN